MSTKQNHRERELSHPQLRLVQLVGEGRSNREIARIIGTTEQAVQDRLREIQNKLGLSHRLELMFWHIENQKRR